MHQPSITKFNAKITHLKFHSNLPGANELIWDIRGLWHQKQVYQAWLSNYIPHNTLGHNYLSMPQIPASDAKVLICIINIWNLSLVGTYIYLFIKQWWGNLKMQTTQTYLAKNMFCKIILQIILLYVLKNHFVIYFVKSFHKIRAPLKSPMDIHFWINCVWMSCKWCVDCEVRIPVLDLIIII